MSNVKFLTLMSTIFAASHIDKNWAEGLTVFYLIMAAVLFIVEARFK